MGLSWLMWQFLLARARWGYRNMQNKSEVWKEGKTKNNKQKILIQQGSNKMQPSSFCAGVLVFAAMNSWPSLRDYFPETAEVSWVLVFLHVLFWRFNFYIFFQLWELPIVLAGKDVHHTKRVKSIVTTICTLLRSTMLTFHESTIWAVTNPF